MENRRQWTQRQGILRKLLSVRATYAEAVELFLLQHAAGHTAGISSCPVWSLQDEVLAGLSDEQIKFCPCPGTNSIAWLLWHTARIEDITINGLVFERPQILHSADWLARLGLTSPDVGAGMDDDEVARLSAQISVPVLKEYRAAVGRATQSNVPGLEAGEAKKIVSPAALQILVNEGSISQKALWLADYYDSRQKGFFLTRITSHNYIHLKEADRVGSRLA